MKSSTNRLAIGAALAAGAVVSSTTLAEPVVLRFDAGATQIALSDYSDAVPALRLYRHIEVGGGGTMAVPAIIPEGSPPGGDCEPQPFASEIAAFASFPLPGMLGGVIDPGQSNWNDAYACNGYESSWFPLLTGINEFSCSAEGCPPDLDTAFGIEAGVYLFPLRIEGDGGAWHAAWVAVDLRIEVIPECSFCTNGGPLTDLETASFTHIGFGYETQPNTPMIAGGGLCEADLNFDAVLDLADVQGFATGFLSGGSAADLNGDGVFDLADIQRFIGSFNTGCGF